MRTAKLGASAMLVLVTVGGSSINCAAQAAASVQSTAAPLTGVNSGVGNISAPLPAVGGPPPIIQNQSDSRPVRSAPQAAVVGGENGVVRPPPILIACVLIETIYRCNTSEAERALENSFLHSGKPWRLRFRFDAPASAPRLRILKGIEASAIAAVSARINSNPADVVAQTESDVRDWKTEAKKEKDDGTNWVQDPNDDSAFAYEPADADDMLADILDTIAEARKSRNR